MSETQVQISDEPGGEVPAGGPAPYQNLWVPLILVPAGIVMAIVVIMALFGGLAGNANTPLENLEVIASGGKNERTQVLMDLAAQAAENQAARNNGEDLPHPYPASFAERAVQVLGGLDEEEYWVRFALGAFVAGLESSPEAVQRGVFELIDLLQIPDGEDESGALRQYVLVNLGLLAQGAVGPSRGAGPAVVPFLKHQNVHLRSTAASVLAGIEGEHVVGALEGALSDSSLSVRAAAAFSLAKLDPPQEASAGVLRDLTATTAYEAVRAVDPTQFTSADGISQLRIKALQSLALLGRDEDWAHISSLRDDPDLNVRGQVLALLASQPEEGL